MTFRGKLMQKISWIVFSQQIDPKGQSLCVRSDWEPEYNLMNLGQNDDENVRNACGLGKK